MSLSQEALQKLLIEMDNQLSKSRAELSLCNLLIERVNTNLAVINTTDKTLRKHCDVSNHENVWKGVGKAFIKTDVKDYLDGIEMDKTQFQDTKESLLKKQHYFETTLEKTVDNMTRIVGGSEKN